MNNNTYKLLVTLFALASLIFAEDKVNLEVEVHPYESNIFIDGKLVQKGGDLNEYQISPGTYNLLVKLNDSTKMEHKITVPKKDVEYKIVLEKKKGGFRIALGGQWMFNEYDKGPISFYSERVDGKVDTTEVTFDKPFTFVTLDVGFLTSKNFYFGMYGELLNGIYALSFSKQWDIAPAVSLSIGTKLGILVEFANSFTGKYSLNGETIDSFFVGDANEYVNYGWLTEDISRASDTGIVTDITSLNALGKFSSIDAQLTLGKSIVKFYLRGSLWFGAKTDYENYDLYNANSSGADRYYKIDYDYKFAVMPSISTGIQFDIRSKTRDVGIYGPFTSKDQPTPTTTPANSGVYKGKLGHYKKLN
jgi:hypothetical protein